MADYDIFNGDADGICALVQLRRAEPRPGAVLVTGVKRDINLLDRINPQKGDRLTVLDISMRNNAAGLTHALSCGANVFYCDHHNAGDIPAHKNLTAKINTKPEVCTGLLIDGHLKGAFKGWAVAAAFGDNLHKSAAKCAEAAGLSEYQTEQLKSLGTLLNYNAYGTSVDDLHYDPAHLYAMCAEYDDPLEFMTQRKDIVETLDKGYASDMAKAQGAEIIDTSDAGSIVVLPDEKWSRRISGMFGNAQAQAEPDLAHGVLSVNAKGGYTVSVRAPLSRREGCDTLCLQFETGGGRAAAAGINHLPKDQVDTFVAAFRETFTSKS